MEKQVLAVLVVLLAVVNVFGLVGIPSDFVELGGKRFSVEVVDTPADRQQGLMFRDSLCVDCGMLFIFDYEQPLSFWMKNTLIPLDIIFIDSNYRVVDIHRAVPCESDPCITYPSRANATYVLEVNAGTFDESIVGSSVRFLI